MKKSKNLLIAIFVLSALLVGFLLGITMDYPKFNPNQVSGTIGKVNNYRNTKVTEADIQLKNELASDTAKLRAVKNYFNFYYVSAVKMNDNINVAVNEAIAAETFRNANINTVAALKSHGNFLFSARTDLLLALSACNSASETDPALLRNLLNDAYNTISQINYRNRTVLEFINSISTFINSNNQGQYPGLQNAHNRLAMNQLLFSLIAKDKVTLKFLDKTKVYGDNKENLKAWDQQQLNSMIQQDMERLQFYCDVAGDSEKFNSFASDCQKLQMFNSSMISESTGLSDAMGDPMSDALKFIGMNNAIAFDAEKLGYKDAEKLGFHLHDAEKLGVYDAEKLGMWYSDIEKLGFNLHDAEKLGSSSGWLDAEKLGAVVFDAEKLGMTIAMDAEKLGAFSDTEKLGFFDAEKLAGGLSFDTEKLGFFDSEQLGVGQW